MGRNPNSKAAADAGGTYTQIKRPDTALDAIDAIDVWARYLHHWGVRVHNEFHMLEASKGDATAAGVATMHLDPPPEPFSS